MKHDHIWTAAGTDIEERWKLKYGWIRPSELPEYQAKYKYFQELPLRKLDDEAKRKYEDILRKANVARVK